MWQGGRRWVATTILALMAGFGQELAPGKLLVATKDMGDPNFAQSVILIVKHDENDGTLGLIINRRTTVPLARVFEEIKGAKADPIYVGGPMETTGAQALLRSTRKLDKAEHIFADIYATGDKDLIEKSIGDGAEASKFRVYIGYGGWAPGQLEHEMELGSWSVIRATVDFVFDEDTDSLWSRLRQKVELRVAGVSPISSSQRRRSDRGSDSLVARLLAPPIPTRP